MKIAKIIPDFEKDDKLDCDSYRLILLLHIFSKIFETLIHHRLILSLENNKKCFKFQFGFRTNNSATHALMSLTEQIHNALDNNKFGCGVFIDLWKALDTVNHKTSLSKFEYYGI